MIKKIFIPNSNTLFSRAGRAARKAFFLGAALMITSFLITPALMAQDSPAASGELRVIVNSQVSSEALKSDFIMNVFLGKTTKWSDGSKIVPVVLAKGETSRNFLHRFVKKTPEQFSTFWKKQIFTGKGTPPKEFESEDDLIKFVAENNGAIGFVTKAPESDKVKEIKAE